MQVLPLADIRGKAHSFNDDGKKWHFHIMAPYCTLNEKDTFAFVLECPKTGESYVYYSDKPEKELGKELAPMLHGKEILQPGTSSDNYVPDENVARIIKRASQLNDTGVAWNHHMLFPGCNFNSHGSKYVLMFEDPESNKSIINLTDSEPTNDLKQIESLFYK